MSTTRVALALMVCAFLVRVVALDRLPPGLWSDEAHNGLEAEQVLRTGRVPVFFPGNCGQEPLHKYLIVLVSAVVGPGQWAVRLPSALAGGMLVPLTFLWWRRRRGEGAALWATALVGFGVWHFHFCRISFRAIMGPTVAMTGLLAVDWAMARPSWRRCVLAGAVASLAWYTYPAHRLLPLVMAAWAALNARGAKRIGALAWGVLGFGVGLLPLLGAWRQYPELFSARASMAALWTETPDVAWGIVRNTLRHLGMFTVEGDLNWRHNLSGEPQLDPLTGFLFLVGLAQALARRDRVDLLVVGWLALMLVPGVLSVERQAPHSLRTIGTLPAPYLLASQGVECVVRWARATPRLQASLMGAIAAVNLVRYFVVWPMGLTWLTPEQESLFGFNRQEFALAAWLRGQSSPRVWLSPQLYLHPTTAYLSGGAPARMVGDLEDVEPGDLVVVQPSARNLWWLRDDFRKNFFLWWWNSGKATEAQTWEALARYYPGCGTGMERADDAVLLERLRGVFVVERVGLVRGLWVVRVVRGLQGVRPEAEEDLSRWRRVPAGCFRAEGRWECGGGTVELWARDERTPRQWLLDRQPCDGPVSLEGCLLFPACVSVTVAGREEPVMGTLRYVGRPDTEPYLRRTLWGRARRTWARFRMRLEGAS